MTIEEADGKNTTCIKRWEIIGDTGVRYIVALKTDATFGCSCPRWKFAYAPKPDCKHILRVRLWLVARPKISLALAKMTNGFETIAKANAETALKLDTALGSTQAAAKVYQKALEAKREAEQRRYSRPLRGDGRNRTSPTMPAPATTASVPMQDPDVKMMPGGRKLFLDE